MKSSIFKKTNEGNIESIKVLGSGCKNCHLLFQNTRKAVQTLGLSVSVEYITDMQQIMKYGVMRMPALIVNEKVTSMGKVLSADDILSLLQRREA